MKRGDTRYKQYTLYKKIFPPTLHTRERLEEAQDKEEEGDLRSPLVSQQKTHGVLSYFFYLLKAMRSQAILRFYLFGKRKGVPASKLECVFCQQDSRRIQLPSYTILHFQKTQKKTDRKIQQRIYNKRDPDKGPSMGMPTNKKMLDYIRPGTLRNNLLR